MSFRKTAMLLFIALCLSAQPSAALASESDAAEEAVSISGTEEEQKPAEETEKSDMTEEAQHVADMISALPAIDKLTSSDKMTVDAIHKAYDNPSDEEQMSVLNRERLDQIEAKFNEIERASWIAYAFTVKSPTRSAEILINRNATLLADDDVRFELWMIRRQISHSNPYGARVKSLR